MIADASGRDDELNFSSSFNSKSFHFSCCLKKSALLWIKKRRSLATRGLLSIRQSDTHSNSFSQSQRESRFKISKSRKKKGIRRHKNGAFWVFRECIV